MAPNSRTWQLQINDIIYSSRNIIGNILGDIISQLQLRAFARCAPQAFRQATCASAKSSGLLISIGVGEASRFRIVTRLRSSGASGARGARGLFPRTQRRKRENRRNGN